MRSINTLAVEDHQTDALARQKKLLEVILNVLFVAPFALSDQGASTNSPLFSYLSQVTSA